MTNPQALIAAFDAACESDSADAEHEAAMAMRDYLADILENDVFGGDTPSDMFPHGEGFGDFDISLYGARPRDVLEGRAVLRPIEAGQYAAAEAETRLSGWLWGAAAVVVVLALVYLLAFAPQRSYTAMDADQGPAPVAGR